MVKPSLRWSQYPASATDANSVVLSGLNPGDEIVSEGAGLMREGTQVK